ncbi:phage portal protein, partial [Levilactobacillus namurensis]|uniref:phage portal protein n=1 Tax=Levilactobacillus namurensis TaxID=380393 RepID=UPI002232A228
ALARYITNIQVGYEFVTPLTFVYQNKDDDTDTGEGPMQALDDFNQNNDEPYHEKIIGKNLANTVRAYELLYVAYGS